MVMSKIKGQQRSMRPFFDSFSSLGAQQPYTMKFRILSFLYSGPLLKVLYISEVEKSDLNESLSVFVLR